MAVGAETFNIGMEVAGRVKHVGVYGALVDIGTGKDAMLHISQLADGEKRSFGEVIQRDLQITAYVYKKRRDGFVALTMEKPPQVPWQSIKKGNTYKGEVTRVEDFGVFVDFGAERAGMVHVSEMADGYVKSPGDIAAIGQEVEVRVLSKSGRPRKIELSMKKDAMLPESMAEVAEDDVEVPTAMLQAFRKAMGGEQNNVKRNSKRAKRNDHRSRQEAILSRTLRGS